MEFWQQKLNIAIYGGSVFNMTAKHIKKHSKGIDYKV